MTVVICPVCHSENPDDAHRCTYCGEPLTMFGQVISRHDGASSPMRLFQARVQAPGLKEQGQRGSAERMGSLEAIDRKRMEAQREASERQAAKDRRILIISAGSFVVLLLVLLAFGAYSLLH